MKVGTLSAAVKYCDAMGMGYDIMYPTHYRWYTKKNYTDNFKWKGPPKEETPYD